VCCQGGGRLTQSFAYRFVALGFKTAAFSRAMALLRQSLQCSRARGEEVTLGLSSVMKPIT